MKRISLKLLFIFPLLFVWFGINAQENLKVWEPATISETASKEKVFRNAVPQDFTLFTINTNNLTSLLENAPLRFSTHSNVVIEFPTKNGKIEEFRVYEAPVLASSLQAQHPNIRSYVAQGIDDPTAIARFSVSNQGLNLMLSSVNYSTIYMDPYTSDLNQYISYSKRSLPADTRTFECLFEETLGNEIETSSRNADDGKLRTYRLALACTGEYAQYHLNNQGIDPGASDEVKKAAVLTAMNTAMTRVNGIYEKDAAVTMVIIGNNTDIIFLNAATDPYTNNNGGTMLGENQTTCDNIIGSANYDIGHVFSTGGGGIAQLQSPCNNGQKARGVTGLSQPIGDGFYVDYVSHEMGHQFGANHTQNNNCQRNNATAMEPGSASTIMGYAGICPPNVQNVSDDYFHAISIQEIWNFISNGSGQCGVQTDTGNLPPTADAGPDYFIPKSTPFILKGIATDPDNEEALSHNWEQMNPQPSAMPPVNTSITGPMFRSDDALSTPDRYMPKLTTVLGGQTQTTWEVVPSVTRTMNFRYTVRDNTAGGASSASDNMVVTVIGDSGPFIITSQDTPTTWQTQTTETITWDVADTDLTPVDCQNVDILFSTDGGQTYDVIVANDIPNNGSADVNVPNLNTSTGRFMVISSNNIFYDINGGEITVEGEILNVNETTFDNFAIWPNPSNGSVNISLTPSSTDDIELILYDIRGSLVYKNDFETNGNLFEKAITFNGLNSGIYFIKVSNNGINKTTKLIIK